MVLADGQGDDARKVLPCAHKYYEYCIVGWARQQGSSIDTVICPSCCAASKRADLQAMTSTPLEVKQLGMPDHAAAAAAAGANAQRADNDVQKLTESEHGMADAEATAPVGQAGPEQTAESKEGLSVAGRESVPEAEEPTLSQQSPRRATKTARGLLQQFNRKAGASYDALLARIKNSPDPSAGFQGRVHRAALDAWNIAKEASKAGEGAAEL